MGWRGWPSDGRHTFNQFTLELSRTTVGWARPGPTLSRPPGGLGGRLERTIQPGRTRVLNRDSVTTRVNKRKAADTREDCGGISGENLGSDLSPQGPEAQWTAATTPPTDASRARAGAAAV